jgi:large subunit ribosomal protein L23Ae
MPNGNLADLRGISMATKAKKPAPRKAASIQTKTGAGPAVGEHSKDAAKKPAFGKAAPRKVTPTAAKTAAPAAKSAPRTAKPAKAAGGPSLVTKIAHVATGAVVATAKGAASLAASVTRKDGAKGKAKAK